MASFAEMIYGTAEKGISKVGDNVPENFARGADLALRQEQLMQQREELNSRKLQLGLQQNKDVLDVLEMAQKTQDPNMQKMILDKVLPAKVRGYGLDSMWSSDVIEALQKSPEARAKAIGTRMVLEEKVSKGEMTAAQALDEYQKTMNDPIMFSQTDADKIYEASKFNTGEKGKMAAAKIRGDQGNGRGEQIQGRFSQSQKTKLADKINSLGLPGMKSAFTELDGALPGGIDSWKPGQKIPGISGAEGALPVNRLTGNANKVRGAAASIGNQILKLRSGAAVSDGEAVRTLAELGMVPVVGEGGTWTNIAWKGVTSDEAFINGMKRARGLVQSVEDTYRNAYGSDVYDSVSPPIKTGGGKSSNPDLVTVDGVNYSKKRLKEIIAANPDHPNTPKFKKALGLK